MTKKKNNNKQTSLVLSEAYSPGHENAHVFFKPVPTVATGSKIQPRCVGLVTGMDWSFCRFLIALSTAIRLMTTASSAIASRFTWRNMAQDKQVKKKGNNCAPGKSTQDFRMFSVLPQVTLQKKTEGMKRLLLTGRFGICMLSLFGVREVHDICNKVLEFSEDSAFVVESVPRLVSPWNNLRSVFF